MGKLILKKADECIPGEEILEELKGSPYDPIRILAMYALGDVVGLGLMTEEAYNAEEVYNTDDQIEIPSGRMRALELVPTALRLKAASELATYIYSRKKQSEPTLPPGNDDRVQIYVPDNGRMEVPHEKD